MNNRFYSDYIVYLSNISVNDENDFKRPDALTKSVKDNMCNTSVKDVSEQLFTLAAIAFTLLYRFTSNYKKKKERKTML
ncbi:MAG: hypothetical protein IIY81_10235 [Lachnospiraceae bacterium]|nr:hypothetical protein [Lachnospiraceae bacterium]